MDTSKRIFGLDILRSVAIILVVAQHSNSLLSAYFPNSSSYIPSIDGVDLFFVLSGYLVGAIIINTAEKHQKFNKLMFFDFMQRRWFRTLPNYFLFLGLNIILIYFGFIKGEINKYLVTYFFFLQNLYKPYDFLFWESWSLSVEEWFYFLFPLFLFLVLIFFKKSFLKIKAALLIIILFFLIIPLFYRIFHAPSHSNILSIKNYWDLYFRKLVLTRMDTIGFGLLGAFLKKYYPSAWIKKRNYLFVLGISILLVLCFAPIKPEMFIYKTFFFSLSGIAIFLLLPKLESFKKENIPLKPFRKISAISYSMYLAHMPLIQIISKFLPVDNSTDTIIRYLMYWIMVVIISAFIYNYFEHKIMDMRENVTRYLSKKNN